MTKDQLDELNIFALRELARQTGVNSPTSKKKDELIKDILEIKSGVKQPHVAKTKQGRPPKSFGYDFADVFDFQKHIPVITLRQDVKNVNEEDIVTVAGFVELLENNSAFLWVRNGTKYAHFFIPKDVLNENNLKAGDYVLADVGNGEKMVVNSIFNINDRPILDMPKSRKDYNNIEAQIPSTKLGFKTGGYEKFHINHGENVYIYGSNNNQNTVEIIKMLNASNVDHKIYINSSLVEKNKIYLNTIENAEMFINNLTDDADLIRRNVLVAVERAKRILELGETAVVAIDDMLTLASIDDSLTLVKNLISLTKDGKHAGKITIFAIMPTDKDLNLIEKLADKRLKFVDGEMICID